MSRIHPTHEELERKSKNIEIERAKTSDFRPTITQGKVEPHPEKVREAQNTSWLAGSILPIPRHGQIPFSEIRKASKARHDARGICSRPDCAFRTGASEDTAVTKALENKEIPA